MNANFIETTKKRARECFEFKQCHPPLFIIYKDCNTTLFEPNMGNEESSVVSTGIVSLIAHSIKADYVVFISEVYVRRESNDSKNEEALICRIQGEGEEKAFLWSIEEENGNKILVDLDVESQADGPSLVPEPPVELLEQSHFLVNRFKNRELVTYKEAVQAIGRAFYPH